jgi:hypothetical protein
MRSAIGLTCVEAAADQEELAVANQHIAIGQLHLSGADSLDLPALQHQPGLVGLFDVVFEPCAAVFRNVGDLL